MRPFVCGVVELSITGTSRSPINAVLVSRLPFVTYYLVTKQTLSCDLAALDFLANFNFFSLTVGVNNEDNSCQSQEIN